MNITLPDPSQFNIKDCIVAGDECVLVTPKDMGVEWTEENKFFRSSIWRKSDMMPVSLGFRKFMNYGEKPEFEPLNLEDGVRAIQKIDGSCLIVSRYRGKLIIRTRGTVDASQLENGHEIEFLKKKYPKVFDNEWLEWLDCGLYTLLFEWTTPTNRIVLNESTEPTLWLIGMVYHPDYSYVNQHNLDTYAKEMGVERPKSYGISLGGSIEDIKKRIELLADIEGVVIYDDAPGYGSGQILKKIKTLRYLQLHRVFTGIKNVNHVVDLWIEHGCLSRDEFEAVLSTAYDHELVVSIEMLLNEMYQRWDDIQAKLQAIKLTLTRNLHLSRKEIAQLVLHEYKIWASIAFEILDSKTHNTKKLFELNKRDEAFTESTS